MTWFNKFIAFIALSGIMILGALAIHSIKVDTLPIDYALGLIAKKHDPIFTLRARAQCADCSKEVTQVRIGAEKAAIEAARNAVSATIGGVINMIKATMKTIMRILQMIKKVFNFFISLLQKFAGKDTNLFSILSSVQDLSGIDNFFKDMQKEWDTVWVDYAKDTATAQKQIADGQASFQQASSIWSACIATSLIEDSGEKVSVDKKQLCDLAIKSVNKVKLGVSNASTLGAEASKSTKLSSIFTPINPAATSSSSSGTAGALGAAVGIGSSSSTSGTTGALSDAGAALGAGASSNPAVTGVLDILYGGTENIKKDTLRYEGVETASKLATDIQQAQKTADAKKAAVEQSRKFAPDCGVYVGPTEKTDEERGAADAREAATGSRAPTPTLALSNIPASDFVIPLNPNSTTFSTNNTSKSIFSTGGSATLTTGTVPANLNFGFSKIKDFNMKPFTPEQCDNAKDSAKTTQAALDQANQTTQPAETAGGIAAVIAALQSIFDLIQTVQQIFQQIMGFINELMSLGQSFMSEFQGFFSSIGNIFQQANSGGSGGTASSNLLSQALEGTPLVGVGAGLSGKPLDDGSVTINDAAISANQDNIAKYADQSMDCVRDDVKNKVPTYAVANNPSVNPDNLPKVGLNNTKTYTNGSNVPDGVMGASVTDGNTPPMTGLTYTKSDKSTGNVLSTPARSLITSGSYSGNPNATYHQCQASPWGDDNSNETAANRLASYPFDAKYGGPSVYRDGVSNDWRVVNNVMNKDIPDQCYLSNNDLSDSEKVSIINSLGISFNYLENQLGDNAVATSQFQKAWQEAKGKLDQAQREGKVRWDSDPNLIYQNRVRGGLIVGSGNDKKEIQIKPGKCEVSYPKDQVDAALTARGWNFNLPETKSFVSLVQ